MGHIAWYDTAILTKGVLIMSLLFFVVLIFVYIPLGIIAKLCKRY